MKKPLILIALILTITAITGAETIVGNEEICGEIEGENILINESIDLCAEGDVTLNATDTIIINGTIDGEGEYPGFTGQQTTQHGSNLTIIADYVQQNKPISLQGGEGEYSNSGNSAAQGGDGGVLNITATTYHGHKINLDGGQGGNGSTVSDEELAKGGDGGQGGKLHIDSKIYHNDEKVTANSGKGGEPGEWGSTGVVGGDAGNASKAGTITIHTARTIIQDGIIQAKGESGTTGGDGEYDSITDTCGIGGDGGDGGQGGKILLTSNNLLIEESDITSKGGDGGQGGKGADCEEDGNRRQGGDGGQGGNASETITIHSGFSQSTSNTIIDNTGGDGGERGEDKDAGIVSAEAGKPGAGYNIKLLSKNPEETNIQNNLLSVEGGQPKGNIEDVGVDGEITRQQQDGDFKKANIKFTEINQSSTEFSKNTREPVEINAIINKTYIDAEFLLTDETGENEKYNAYTQNIEKQGDKTLLQFKWDDVNNVLQAEPINYQIGVEGLTEIISDEKEILLVMQPVIDQNTVDATINDDGIAIIRSNVLHPIGQGRINEVEYKIESPDGRTDTVTARAEDLVEDGDMTGREYIYQYVNTQEAGTYSVTVTAKGDGGTDQFKDTFTVSPIEALGTGEISLNPFIIGEQSIIDAVLDIDIDNTFARLGAGVLLLALLVGLINVVGDSGAERNRFLEDTINR